MNTFEKIQAVAQRMGIPAYPDVYSGKESARPERWITYNFSDNRGTLFADDEPNAVVHSVQVHLFLPANKNFLMLQNTLRNELFAEGFTYPDITVLIDERTTASSGTQKIRHIAFDCEIQDEEFNE